MAKNKDITRNPPSWLEKGLFVCVILIIVGIAFPIFWKLNEQTRIFYECVGYQNELQAAIDKWAEDNNIGMYGKNKITLEELMKYYDGDEIPCCPDDGNPLFTINATTHIATMGCQLHKYDSNYETYPTPDATKAATDN